jgi:hypothetical protein
VRPQGTRPFDAPALYRQGIPEIGLYIERNTDRTPEPLGFYVFWGSLAEGPFRTFKDAQPRYLELRVQSGYTPPALEKDDADKLIAHERHYMGQLDAELYWADFRARRQDRRR